MSHKSCFLAGLAAALVLANGLQAFGGKPTKPPAISYQIVQLDLADSAGVTYTRSFANGINRQGQVVGLVQESSAGCLPACWTISKIDGLQSELKILIPPDLPDEPNVYAAACGINESGLIVGGWDNGGAMARLLAMHSIGPTGSRPGVLPPLDVLDSRRSPRSPSITAVSHAASPSALSSSMVWCTMRPAPPYGESGRLGANSLWMAQSNCHRWQDSQVPAPWPSTTKATVARMLWGIHSRTWT